MSESESTVQPGRVRRRRKIVIRRDDHIGDPIGIVWLAGEDTIAEVLIQRLGDYLGPRVKIVKAEISRDIVEVEVEARGWGDEAARLAAASRDLFQKGAKRNALSMCREAVELDPLNPAATATLGIILTGLQRHKEALDALKRAREFGAGGIEVMLAMTQCAMRLDRLAAATQYAEEALRLEPRNLTARRTLKEIKQSSSKA